MYFSVAKVDTTMIRVTKKTVDKVVNITLLCLLVGWISSCTTVSKPPTTGLIDTPATLLKTEGEAIFQYWELDQAPYLWAFDIGELSELKQFKDTLRTALGIEQFIAVVEKEATQKAVLPMFDKLTGDQKNAALVHTGKLGKIRRINWLESQLLNYQLCRYPLIQHPTEFHAFILTQSQNKKVRVYFGASDQPWPPNPKVLISAMEQDIANGWRLKYHLHNHYESADKGYLGILAPSLADAHYYKMLVENYQLETALITNGYHTVAIHSTFFDQLESH